MIRKSVQYDAATSGAATQRRPANLLLLTVYCLLPAVCLAADCESGACRQAEQPHPAVVRIMNASARYVSYGSGTLVEKDEQSGLVLTCAHLFQGARGEVTVVLPDGTRRGGRVIAVDETWDLAAVEIAAPAASPVIVSADPPRPGDLLQSCGYGREGRYACNRGRALGYARTTTSRTHETLELTGMAREGDSGGPVFNARGELVAVLWGTDGRTVEATYCGRVRSFLASLLGRRCRPVGPPASPLIRPPVTVDPGPKAPSPGQTPASPPSPSADRLEEIRRRLESHEGTLRERGEGLQQAIALAGELKRRIENVETTVGGDRLRALVREAAAEIVTQAAPSLLERVLPAALTALGWTGPPSIAVIVALRLMARARSRRRQNQAQGNASRNQPRRSALNDDYAGQLAGVFALSGHSPLADATLGREYDEQLRQAETSSDGALARWAKNLRQRVADKFYRIHSESPAPGDPVQST